MFGAVDTTILAFCFHTSKLLLSFLISSGWWGWGGNRSKRHWPYNNQIWRCWRFGPWKYFMILLCFFFWMVTWLEPATSFLRQREPSNCAMGSYPLRYRHSLITSCLCNLILQFWLVLNGISVVKWFILHCVTMALPCRAECQQGGDSCRSFP